MTTTDIRNMVSRYQEEMIRLRRDFHQHPELGFQEKRTAGVIAEYLRTVGVSIQEGIGKTGVIGLLSGKLPGKTLLLRADMDALPIQEQTGAAYASVHENIMHACGHDGHMAILLGTARTLSELRNAFTGTVKFVFQPAEENLGGAREMIRDGVLENPRVDGAFGLHIINQIPVGMIAYRSGAIMAAMDSFMIRIKGKGGHSAMPEGGIDAIAIAAQVALTIQGLIQKELSPLTPLIVNVGSFHGGTAANVIAETVELTGTVRCLDEQVRKSIPGRMERILRGITTSMRGDFELEYSSGYPPTINNARMTELVRLLAIEVAGADSVFEVPPTMASEDMSFYLQQVPGSYFYVGGGNA
ncbi:MAG TPA: amidohydrolase, partial [Deltaproteobacteria bacterium]|nr:amidohydrolase [Deltaproteobacteria bacterium]